MLKEILNIITNIFCYYFFFIEITYIYFKYIKKDNRFNGVGLFKYLESPIKTLKGGF